MLDEANRVVVNMLKKQTFSVILDETTDVSSTKCLCVVVRYFDFNYGKVRDRFLSLIELFEFDAKSIFGAIYKFFDDLSDDAAVIVGKKSGVRSLLLKDNPNMFTLGCTCHVTSLFLSCSQKKSTEY